MTLKSLYTARVPSRRGGRGSSDRTRSERRRIGISEASTAPGVGSPALWRRRSPISTTARAGVTPPSTSPSRSSSESSPSSTSRAMTMATSGLSARVCGEQRVGTKGPAGAVGADRHIEHDLARSARDHVTTGAEPVDLDLALKDLADAGDVDRRRSAGGDGPDRMDAGGRSATGRVIPQRRRLFGERSPPGVAVQETGEQHQLGPPSGHPAVVGQLDDIDAAGVQASERIDRGREVRVVRGRVRWPGQHRDIDRHSVDDRPPLVDRVGPDVGEGEHERDRGAGHDRAAASQPLHPVGEEDRRGRFPDDRFGLSTHRRSLPGRGGTARPGRTALRRSDPVGLVRIRSA